MPIVVGEMTVEPAAEPERNHAGAIAEQPADGPLAPRMLERIEQALCTRAERLHRLRAD